MEKLSLDEVAERMGIGPTGVATSSGPVTC
jgi:hypothetical protein